MPPAKVAAAMPLLHRGNTQGSLSTFFPALPSPSRQKEKKKPTLQINTYNDSFFLSRFPQKIRAFLKDICQWSQRQLRLFGRLNSLSPTALKLISCLKGLSPPVRPPSLNFMQSNCWDYKLHAVFPLIIPPFACATQSSKYYLTTTLQTALFAQERWENRGFTVRNVFSVLAQLAQQNNAPQKTATAPEPAPKHANTLWISFDFTLKHLLSVIGTFPFNTPTDSFCQLQANTVKVSTCLSFQVREAGDTSGCMHTFLLA